MDWVSNEILNVLIFLLPGFFSAWIFYNLTAFPKPSEFERIVQAIIFTIIIQGLTVIFRSASFVVGNYCLLGTWTKNVDFACTVIIAIPLGLVFSYFANSDTLHKYLRKMNITSLTSYPTQWFGVFKKSNTYVVLHLKDNRRIYGWPEEWPDSPNEGHFSLAEAEWLTYEY